MKSVRIAGLLVLSLLLGGCSAMKLAYDNADTFLMWRGGQYLAFEGEAKEEYGRRVQRVLAWHRKVALPQYAALAEDAAARLERGLTPADMDWFYSAYQAQMREGLRAVSLETADLLDTVSPMQLQAMQKRFAEDNRKFAKDHALGKPVAERRERRVERNLERLRDWMGTVTEAQVEILRQYAAKAPLDEEWRDRERRRLQGELVQMLRERGARARLATWAPDWEKNREPEYEKLRREHRRELQAMVLELNRTMTPAQRAHAVRRLRGFSNDFALLASAAIGS